jgi:peptidoglycan/LPS O-acetylase OafA/YrhL
VLAVVLDHLLGWPHGGFVGVDVFFVISGFLITGILLKEQERRGSISWRGFYRRRLKRIMPAATLVIAATVAASWFVFGSARWFATVVDAVYALLFAGNWRFALQSTDYFAQDLPTSPLQQFWSLGVEEQFYFVWPWLMLAVFLLVTRGGRSTAGARVAVFGILALITAASFAWAMWETDAVPNRAYFSTLSRTWELGVGALLAVASSLLARLPDALRPVLAWTGLAGMTASLFVITPETAFPAPTAALPVMATALVLAAGTGIPQQRWLFPLTNRVSEYVGDLSYSLYLWHFPIIVLGTTLWGRGWLVLALLAAAIAVTSMYSFHLVEDPVRRSAWLEPRGPGDSGVRRLPQLTDGQAAGWKSLAAVLSVLLLVSLQASVPDREQTAAAPVAPVPAADERLPAATGALQADIRTALQATRWPDLDPPIDDAVGGKQAPDEVLACGTSPAVDVEACTWGPDDAQRTAVVVGDSIAMTYVTTLREALDDWRVISLGGFGCTFTTPLIANNDPELERACPARKQDAVDVINQIAPDAVFITNIQFPRQPVGAGEPLSEQEWATATLELVEQFTGAAGEVVFLAPPPADKDLNACYTRVGGPQDCVSLVTSSWTDRARTEQGMATAVQGVWLDSRPWFCSDGRCPAFVGDTPTKVDATHMTPTHARQIAPAVRDALQAVDLFE